MELYKRFYWNANVAEKSYKRIQQRLQYKTNFFRHKRWTNKLRTFLALYKN